MHQEVPNKFKVAVLATRPWSFSMTALSVLLGSFVVQSDGFLWLYFAANLVGMILVHAATNVLNDYYDDALSQTSPRRG